MDKDQIFSIKTKLWHSHCPICLHALINFANQAAGYTCTIDSDEERSFLNSIDIGNQKTFTLKCNNCGYIMTFDKQQLIKKY